MTNERANNPKYQGKDNYGKPRSEYIARIAAMNEVQLLHETEQKIWLSAYAQNNSRADQHWQVDACYDEWVSRGRPDAYDAALKAAKESAGC
jgi:hypothetical protein